MFSAKAAGADNVHYHAGNRIVYVAHGTTLTELDAQNGESKAAIKLSGSIHGFNVDEKAGKIYAVLTKPSVVAVVDVAKREVTDQFAMTLADAGSPIDRDPKTGHLFVGCPKKGMIVILDPKSGKELAGIDIPLGIDDLHFDEHRNRLYASCSDGNLAVLEKKNERWITIAKLKSPKNSRTCAWAGGKLYLGVPRQDDSDGPGIWVYEPDASK